MFTAKTPEYKAILVAGAKAIAGMFNQQMSQLGVDEAKEFLSQVNSAMSASVMDLTRDKLKSMREEIITVVAQDLRKNPHMENFWKELLGSLLASEYAPTNPDGSFPYGGGPGTQSFHNMRFKQQ